ncbi:MAG: FecR family protein [Hyphomicrobiales bacterium]
MKALTAILFCILVALAGTAGAAERVGVAAMVKSQVKGTIGGRTKDLSTGDPVFHREVIAANADGRAQLIFVDETVFSVGAGATVTLDEFVYNPSRRAGSIVLNVTAGAFRFISGSAKPSTYTIKTPVALIGVRGTIFSGNVLSANHMTLKLRKGKLLICPEPGKRVEGNVSKQTRVRRGERDCVLIEPGEYQIGSGASEPPVDDPGILGTDPNDGIDALDGPIRCTVLGGVVTCN